MSLNQLMSDLSDEELLARGDAVVRYERRSQAVLLAIIGEIDKRRIFSKMEFPHMFAFCVGRWGYAKDAAYRRLHAARACRFYPEALSMIDDGSLQLSGLATLEPFLRDHGGVDLLARARGMGRRDVERLVAEIAPRPDIHDTMRTLPSPPKTLASVSPPGTPPQVSSEGRSVLASVQPVAPLPLADRICASAPERVQFSFSGSEELRGALGRIRDLLWHKYPFARLEDLVLEIAKDYLERHDPQRKLKLAAVKPPRLEDKRRVPQWVRDRVWARDKGRCAFTAEGGRRCDATGGLELDHVVPWAKGGRSDDPENVRLLCRAHNQMLARL